MPSIYDDPDVARTYSTNGPDAVLLISQLGAEDAELARTFFDGQAACYNSKFALADCLASLRYGVEAVDGFSAATPVGWKKNIVFEMTKPLDQLFYEHERRSEAQAFAEWMEQTIFQNGWHVDASDELTALGVRRQECTNIWMQVGMRRDSNGNTWALRSSTRVGLQRKLALSPGRPDSRHTPYLTSMTPLLPNWWQSESLTTSTPGTTRSPKGTHSKASSSVRPPMLSRTTLPSSPTE